MRSSLIADAVIFTRRPTILKIASDHLKMKGVSNVLTPGEAEACTDNLVRFPKALLVADWEGGPPEPVVRILSANRRSDGQLRPILLIASTVSEQLIATAAEYGVTQIFTEAVTIKNLGARIANLLIADSMPDDIRKTLGEVSEARTGGDLKASLQLLQKALQKHPTNLRLKAEAAETLLGMGEAEKALTLLSGMEKTKPPYLRGIHLLGRCFMRLGRFEEGVQTLEQATLFNPHDADRLADIGQAFLQMDRIKEAGKKFDAALLVEPSHRQAKLGKGQTALMDGDVNEALAVLREVAGEVEMASIFNSCAVLNMRRGRHEAGMNLYSAALKALGKNSRLQARLYFNMGIGFRRWGKKDKASQAFQTAIKLDPNYKKAEEHLHILKHGDKPLGEVVQETLEAEESLLPKGGQTKRPHSEPALEGDDDFTSDLDSMLDDDMEESLFKGRKPA